MNDVSVTTDQETLAKIDKIIALLPTSERITGNYSGSVPLQAIDRNGVVLPVVITPFDTTMKVTTKPVVSSSSASNSKCQVVRRRHLRQRKQIVQKRIKK